MKPNILMIISHDTGRYLGSYGRNIDTPELNDLAEKGVQFNNYFCTQPQCSPSRGSILTGMYGHNHGMLGLAHMGYSMKKDIATIPYEMSSIGYETWLFGFFHESIDGKFDGEKLGYQRVVEVPDNAAKDVTNKVVEFLQKKSKSRNASPFYASVGFEETHRPFDHFEPVPIEEVEVPDYLPDTPEVRKDLAQFYGSVKELDKNIGRIKRSLSETGLLDNTLLIYTTDHGIAFPRAKGTLFDAGLETALIMKLPKGMKNDGRVVNDLICNIDLMPTLIDLVGGDVPESTDGFSFLPILNDEPFDSRTEFFCELTWHDRYHPMRGLRTNKYKYIRNFEDGPKVYLPFDIHQSLSGQVVRKDYYVPNTSEELYDLENDPFEQLNLVDDEKYIEILRDCRAKVQRWMEESDDPLLEGKVHGKEATVWEKEIKEERVYNNALNK